jgi:UDP-N-acetylglucosamine:LPS N-acetylglucosamine transferase
MKLERVIISGGGTGGHIFPAIAIADEIKKLTESTTKEQTYTQNKSRFSKQAIKPINDNSYPFKQETFKLNCLII